MSAVDVIIIGSGPAGVSAALYTRRAGLNTLIIGRDSGSLAKADKIENYYGFSEPVSGIQLINSGIAAAKRIGVNIISDEVVSIQYNGYFTVKTKMLEVLATCVVIATGSSRKAPKIEGLERFEGRGVSYCAVCDGFFYRGKDVCVIGEGSFALHEAEELKAVARSVTLLTNGAVTTSNIPEGISVRTDRIHSISGDETVEEVIFMDGTTVKTNGVFIALGVAGSTDLARQVGAATEAGKIIVDENMATNVPGLYAAGDCTAGMLQVAKAVYEGAKAGTEVIKFVRNNAAGKSERA
ncbi:MAG: Thioredoxin reductase [Firmicutes bacterium ADurb.Bin193]|nr:MAG: Thioredoxin reductase [Firmicutes bacterium ADurb.Bin193]